MKCITILLVCLLGSAFADENIDKDDDHLQQLAATIMQNLQKDHMPSDDSTSGAHNAPLHNMHNIGKHAITEHYFNGTDKVKVLVGVKGVKFVSVERNGKVVNITTAFGVGAVALYKIDREEDSNNDDTEIDSMSEESSGEIDYSLEPLRKEYLDENCVAKPNETRVIVAQKARFGMKLRQKDRKVKVKVDHGYVVFAKTNVTKGNKSELDVEE